jgi:hypothetical protein
MKTNFETEFDLIQISKSKTEIKSKDKNKFPNLFPKLSNIIEEIGLIKMINDKRILCDYSNFYHVNYLIERKKGIENIKNLSIKFNFSLDIFLKAVDYMDRYFLSNKLENIKKISSICLLISLKFNESCPKTSLYKTFLYFLKYQFGNLFEIEQDILITLNYDLNTFTLMDIIHIFFIKYSHLFDQFKEIPQFKKNIWLYAEAIIEDQRFLDFTKIEYAICLIHYSLLNHFFNINKIYFQEEWDEYHKNLYYFDKMKFLQIKLILNIIISSKFKDFFVFK